MFENFNLNNDQVDLIEKVEDIKSQNFTIL